MNIFRTIWRSAIVFFVAVLIACGSSDPKAISKEIAELQAKNFPMTKEQQANFAELMEKGQAMLKEGKTSDSINALKQALAILKKAEDAAMFNKSE